MADRDYGRTKERAAAYEAKKSLVVRDIAGGYPDAGDLLRRSACANDLRKFLETYFPGAFRLAWSADHLRVIGTMQAAIVGGGLFALAMPRGSGKSTISERAALWALLYRHRRFVCLVGATEAAAGKLLEHIKSELLNNDLLAMDFRDVCYPIRRIENNARRCNGQLYLGERTSVQWSAKGCTFPTMPDSGDGPNVSGSTVTVAGLTGALRGQSHTLASGEVLRPDLVILDDPQTRESARSSVQTAARLEIVRGDVLGMAGPDRKITAILPCTVISENDLADQLLDREKSPQWQGERTRAVYAWPANDKLWDDYLRIRSECLRHGETTARATDSYIEHQAEMDLGAEVAWPERFDEDAVTAIQHAINVRSDIGYPAYEAEYQNNPVKAESDLVLVLTADEIAARVGGVGRGIVPHAAAHLTASIDVHDNLLFWSVCAWTGQFSGWVVAYGTYPEQRGKVFSLRQADPTLSSLAPGAAREGSIRAGLDVLAGKILGREWQREGGSVLRVERCLVDSGYLPDTIHEFCRRSPHAAIVMPSRGIGIGAKARPMVEYIKKEGERLGWYWLIATTAGKSVRYVRFDSNFWKSFIHARLAVSLGDAGSLALYGHKGEDHRLIGQHLVAEAPTRVTANGRTVDEWLPKPGGPDNHYLDTIVGNAVAASMLGATLPESAAKPPAPSRPAASKTDYERKRREFESKRGY